MRAAVGLIAAVGLLVGLNRGTCGEAAPQTESQNKALFLLNFARYTEWPADAFTETNSPIRIGLVAGDKIEKDLRKAVEGKTVNGRGIVLVRVTRAASIAGCNVLFVGSLDKRRLTELLEHVKTKPVLTVGENDQFTQLGGIIKFVKKQGKPAFQVDLNAARKARLQISSKLLSLADSVVGKPQ